MSARRLLSVLIAIAVGLSTLPLGMAGLAEAYGDSFVERYEVYYEAWNEETGQMEDTLAMEGSDYLFTPIEGTTQVWFQMINPEIPLHALRIRAICWVGADQYIYTVYDMINQTDLLNLTDSEMMPVSLSLVDEMLQPAPVAGISVTASGNPPQMIGDPGAIDTQWDDQGAGDLDWNEPGTGDPNGYDQGTGDPNWNEPGEGDPSGYDQGTGDQNWNDLGTGDQGGNDADIGIANLDDQSAGDLYNANQNIGNEPEIDQDIANTEWNGDLDTTEYQEDQGGVVPFRATADLLDNVNTDTVGQPASDYARVLFGGTELYAVDFGGSENDPPIAMLPENTHVIFDKNNASRQPEIPGVSETYKLVTLVNNSMVGYVKESGVYVLTEDEKKIYMQTIQPQPLEKFDTDFLRIDAQGVVLTLETSGASPIAELSLNELVTYLPGSLVPSYCTDLTTGQQYVYVMTAGGQQGYIPKAAAKFLTSTEYQEYLSADVFPDSRPSDYAWARNATMYRMPGEAAQTLGAQAVVKLLEGAEYPVQRQDSQNRYRIQLFVEDYESGARGYVLMSQLQFDAAAEQYKNDQEAQKNAAPPMPQHDNEYARINDGGADLYRDLGITRIETLPKGTIVSYMNDQEKDKVRWLYVLVQGTNLAGNVDLSNVTFLTAQEKNIYEQEMTVGNTESNYAYVNVDGTPLYDKAFNANKGTRSRGDVVVFQASSQEPILLKDGKAMLRIELPNNDHAYIAKSAISFVSKAQEDEIRNPVVEAPVTYQPGTMRYGRISSSSRVFVRAAASDTSAEVARLTKDNIVLVTDRVAAGSDYWYKVVLSDSKTEGFIRSDLVTLVNDADNQLLDQTQSITPPKKEEPQPIPVPQPPAQQISGYMRAKQLAPLVDWPSVGAIMRAAVDKGTVLYVTGQQYGEDGKTLFHSTRYGETFGYIQATYMEALTPAELQAYLQSTLVTAPPAVTAPPVSSNMQSGYGLVLDNNVNFRTGTSTSSSALGKLSKNTIVRLVGETTVGDYVWYQAESGGKTGYLRGDYLMPLTVQQYLSVVSSPSYNQGGNVITPQATANTSGINTNTWSTPKPGASSGISFVTIPPLASASPDPNASASPDPSASPSIDPSASPGDGVGTATPTVDPLATLPPLENVDFPEQDTEGASPPSLLIILLVILLLGGGGGYGYYVYNNERKKKAKEAAQRNAAEARSKAQAAMQGTAGQPAVRRPVPPGAPQPGQQPGKPGQPGQPVKPGIPPQTAQRPGAPAQPGQPLRPNPYARPTQSGTGTPGQPRPGQTMQPGQPVQPGQQRPAQPGQARPMQPGQPGQPGQQPRQGTQPAGQARPMQPSQPQPGMARPPQPGQPPRTMEVTSTAPRAQVDGKPVQGVQPNPYARNTEGTDAVTPPQQPPRSQPTKPEAIDDDAPATDGESRRRRRRTDFTEGM